MISSSPGGIDRLLFLVCVEIHKVTSPCTYLLALLYVVTFSGAGKGICDFLYGGKRIQIKHAILHNYTHQLSRELPRLVLSIYILWHPSKCRYALSAAKPTYLLEIVNSLIRVNRDGEPNR